MKTSFTTTIFQAEGMKATGIRVPEEAVQALGKGKRPPVKVTIAGYTYRSTVAVYGGDYLLPLAAEHRQAAGVKAGDEVEVTLELDIEPRTVDIPGDLAAALDISGAQPAFDALAPSRKKEFVRQIEDARTEETRGRRIANNIEKLKTTGKF
ncbi:MAG: DUF1905 domain-containing protein [Anaerolineae bacterium]|nr:DUF1905 domain-containing protein [Anaerolineae bacterium]